MADILDKIKNTGLKGRSGAGFPVAEKWLMVKTAPGDKKYVVCNASEGEPGVLKDLYLLENHPETVIDGMKIAIDYFQAEKGILYLNPRYHKKLEKKLKNIAAANKIELFKKDHSAGYIGGEETSMINHIEGKRVEPRFRPPYPQTHGLHGCPTLVNNVETFYQVSLINAGKYLPVRFYTVNGDCLYTGVYEFPDDVTIADVLKNTSNYPDFDFFVQVGGDGAGYVYNNSQLDQPVSGSGSITVYSMMKHRPFDLIRRWSDFFVNESCGQCAPCREGNYRLNEILSQKEPDWQLFKDILTNLAETSFCGLGIASPWAISSYIKNVVIKYGQQDKIPGGDNLALVFKK